MNACVFLVAPYPPKSGGKNGSQSVVTASKAFTRYPVACHRLANEGSLSSNSSFEADGFAAAQFQR